MLRVASLGTAANSEERTAVYKVRAIATTAANVSSTTVIEMGASNRSRIIESPIKVGHSLR